MKRSLLFLPNLHAFFLRRQRRVPLALLILLGTLLSACATAPQEARELPPLPQAAPPVASNPDIVDVYIVPLEDFPEPLAASVAKTLAQDLKLWIKATPRLGHMDVAHLPGSNQLMSEDLVMRAQPIIRRFAYAGPQTYYLLLTTQDINSSAASVRFQFSAHQRDVNTSVVSMARILNYRDGQRYADKEVYERLYKLMKRAIGEMRLGWQRSTNRRDLMYSPLMSVQDLDSISFIHDENRPSINVPVIPVPIGI